MQEYFIKAKQELFNWTGADDVQRQYEKDNFHAGSHRHDDTRNWAKNDPLKEGLALI